MRWFTRERYENSHFDDWDALIKDYGAYIQSVRDTLPQDLQRLAPPNGFNLHDAQVDIAEIDLVRHTARFRFLTGDAKRFVDCRYSDSDFGESKLQYFEFAIDALRARRDASGAILGWGPLGRVLYDEITVVGGLFRHAFMVWPLGDFAVTFGSFSLTIEPSSDGRLPERSQRFLLTNAWSTE